MITAVAQFQSLAWEFLHTAGTAHKIPKQTNKQKKKENKQKSELEITKLIVIIIPQYVILNHDVVYL